MDVHNTGTVAQDYPVTARNSLSFEKSTHFIHHFHFGKSSQILSNSAGCHSALEVTVSREVGRTVNADRRRVCPGVVRLSCKMSTGAGSNVDRLHPAVCERLFIPRDY
jgi:hypothetical protein